VPDEDNFRGHRAMNLETMHYIIVPLGFISLIAASAYIVAAVLAIIAWKVRRWPGSSPSKRPVSVLKPLCGMEPGLYANLRSFCSQNYPIFEIIFGVRESADPACLVVERLMAEFPALPIKLIVDSQLHGTNRKVSNLINMLRHANHEWLVMADSDAIVRADYLSTVTAPLLNAAVGLVTCLYRAIPKGGVWSRLGAMYVNEWYMPLVLLSWQFGYREYVSGQTVCIRHSTLRAVGGLEVLSNHLAEDNRLGQLVRGLNLQIELSPYVLDGEHYEPHFRSMVGHEFRWMRTIRALRPRSFMGLFLTFSLPMAFLGIVLATTSPEPLPFAWYLFGGTLVARIALHVEHRINGGARSILCDLWLLPLSDLLIFWVWFRSFFTSRITWKDGEFDVGADGVMRPGP
jgi:ceramide glucosyltransferase